MPGPIYLAIPQNAAVSSATFLDRADRALVVEVPSHAPTLAAVRLEFSAQGSDGGSAGPFAPLLLGGDATTPGSGGSAVWSGGGPGFGKMVAVVPTPWVRVSCTGSTTAVATFTLHAVVR